MTTEAEVARAERLALLMEELAESIAIAGKAQRHGLDSVHPDTTGPTNAETLERELGDVMAAIELLVQEGDLDWQQIYDAKAAKWDHVGQWLHYNEPVQARSIRR